MKEMGKGLWNKGDGGDFLSFRTMISASLIKVVYILGMLGIFIGGLVIIIGAIAAGQRLYGTTIDVLVGVLWGIGVIVVGNTLWRIFCEGLMLAFSIQESLTSIESRLRALRLPDTSSMYKVLESMAKELTGGVLRLTSIERELKKGLQLTQKVQPPLIATSAEPESQQPERISSQTQQGQPSQPQSPQAESTPSETLTPAAPKSEERPKPSRHWGRWAFLILLIAVAGTFIALPVASGYSKLQSLEPEAISRFVTNIWDYWRELLGV